MARVELIDPDDAPEALRPTYEVLTRQSGLVLNFFKAMGHAPDVLAAVVALDDALRRSELDPQLRELAYLRASELNGCDYCRHYHHVAARRVGLTEYQVHELDQLGSSDAYDDRQRAVVRYAEQVTREARADDDLVAKLQSFLSDRELVELTATIALAAFTNRMNNALKIGLP
jgi:uncharacterized peroxidase-related enzyme